MGGAPSRQSAADRWQNQRALKLHLVFELDSVLLVRPAACLGHQRDGVGRACSVGVLDEVRMPRRDPGAADPVALQAASLEHQAGCELVNGALEEHSATWHCVV